jgi:dihydropteroate synthase
MHMQGTPQTMQNDPSYEDVTAEIHDWLLGRRDALLAAGIEREKICLDPGIGFGKTHEHNLDLMRGCGRFHDLGCPVLVGHSRKGFIGKVAGAGSRGSGVEKASGGRKPTEENRGADDRLAGTIGGALAVARQGVQVIRVHDVREVREALVLFEVCGGME